MYQEYLMTDFKIGLIGYGKWVRNAYLPALQRDGRGKISAVCAASEASRARAAEELGAEIAVFDNHLQLLKEADIDVVFVAVPDFLHEEVLTAALDTGLPVFYEPPVTNKNETTPAMLKRLLAAPQVTHADIELAFIPVVARAHELLEQGALGELQTISIRLQSSWGPKPGFMVSNINHMSSWYVDIFNSILGRTPRRVMMFDGHGVEGKRQSHSSAVYDYDGVWGQIKANIASLDKLNLKVELNGDDGDCVIDMVSGELRLRTRDNAEWRQESWPASKPYADFPGMNESIAAFFDAVESGVPSHGSAENVARLHLAGLAADISRDNGTWAEIPDIDSL